MSSNTLSNEKKSSFQLISYKVDDFHFEMNKHIGILLGKGSFPWEFSVSVAEPQHFPEDDVYIVSIKIEGVSKNKIQKKDSEEIVEEKSLIFQMTTAGVFKTENKFLKEEENNLLKFQAPALLFSQSRAVITSFLACAGFGSVELPLVNFRELR